LRAVFLANSFHLKRTKSSDFFISLMRETFDEVRVIPFKEAWAQIPGRRWDALVVFMGLMHRRELEALGIRNVLLIPMYDGCPHERLFWLQYSGVKILSFSRRLFDDLRSWGLDAHYAQYFPPTPASTATSSARSLSAFFWPRTDKLTWGTVKKLVGKTSFERIHFHWTGEIHPDIAGFPSDDDVRSYRLQISGWTADRDEYQRLLDPHGVFFASRASEGIGMSFLEAMSLGMCVAAPDQPTMNEYIQHGRNGLLYDLDNPAALDFTRWRDLGHAAATYCSEGRVRWEASKRAIQDFLRKPMDGFVPHPHPLIRVRRRTEAGLRGVYRFGKKLLRGSGRAAGGK
jgi:glycosyltransferase involved in cell wall biosynthesis